MAKKTAAEKAADKAAKTIERLQKKIKKSNKEKAVANREKAVALKENASLKKKAVDSGNPTAAALKELGEAGLPGGEKQVSKLIERGPEKLLKQGFISAPALADPRIGQAQKIMATGRSEAEALAELIKIETLTERLAEPGSLPIAQDALIVERERLVSIGMAEEKIRLLDATNKLAVDNHATSLTNKVARQASTKGGVKVTADTLNPQVLEEIKSSAELTPKVKPAAFKGRHETLERLRLNQQSVQPTLFRNQTSGPTVELQNLMDRVAKGKVTSKEAGTALKALQKVAGRVRLGKGAAAAGIGGGLLALILPKIFGSGDEKKTGELSQIDLFQSRLLAEFERDQALAQSLIGSRQASANRSNSASQLNEMNAVLRMLQIQQLEQSSLGSVV